MIDTTSNCKRVTILVIKDSPTQSKKLKFILDLHNFSVLLVSDINEAFAALEREIPSIVISDIIMPKSDGYRLCRAIKKSERFKNIPVILLSCHSEPQDVLKGLVCGADSFIVKPYDETNLVNHIQHILVNEEMRKETKLLVGVEISGYGQRYLINSDRKQILDLLLSTCETAVQNNYDLNKAQNELNELGGQPEQEMAKKTAFLIKEIHKRKLAEDGIRKLIAEKEQQLIALAALTARMERSNRELEAFSFSEIPEQRAPLKIIDGFSRALLEDCRERPDEQGQDYLRKIRNACRRMDQLIDDMLKLSRITLDEMKYERIDFSALVRSIVEELMIRQPDKKMEIIIQEGMTVRGDLQLFSLVLENMIDNTLKFTGRQDSARIEAGVNRVDGQDVYYLRDNGAGFDMTYADKLFTPFQRLHDDKKFTGTGAGLSIVKRVIQRHGENVWAVGAVDQGATFSFTLR